MDDDEDDKSLLEKTIEAVKDMASSVTDAAKSAATPSEEEKMTVMDVPLVADAAAMPMPLVAPKKWKATVKRAPAKTPPKKATAEKAAKKTAKKSAKKAEGLPEEQVFTLLETTSTPAPTDVTLVAAT